MSLTPPQFQQLHAALLAAFDAQELSLLLRFTYPPELSRSVNWNQALDAVVTQLLNVLDERGDVEPLIRGMLQARPQKAEVVTFCREHFPRSFQAAVPTELVAGVTGGLTALIAALADPGIRVTLGQFQ